MEVNVSQMEGVAVVSSKGELDAAQAPELEKTVSQVMADGQRRIVIDLEHVNFIDSSGLATLIKTFKRTRGAGGNLALAALQPAVRRVFDLTRLDKAFDIFSNTREAVSRLTR